MKQHTTRSVRNDAAVASPTTRQFVRFTANIQKQLVRNDSMEGKDFVVAPSVMIVEGVLNGSCGPILYPAEELSKIPESWNHKPVIVNHQGPESVTACTPKILTDQKVGVLMNTSWDSGKKALRTEAWIEKSRSDVVEPRITEALTNQTTMELSTGLFLDLEATPGEYNGVSYVGIARNIRPDHLAILPDSIGACSVAAGAGFIRNELAKRTAELGMTQDACSRATRFALYLIGAENELSHETVRDHLRTLLRDRFTASPSEEFLWVEAVYDDFVVYELGSKLYQLGYTSTNDVIKLSDEDPSEVVRITEYRTVSGAFVGNATGHHEETGKNTMDKKTIVATLIKNHGWKEEDRVFLEGLDDARLGRIMASASTPPKTETTKNEGPAPAVTSAPKTEETPVVTSKNEGAPKFTTLDEYLAAVPADVRNVVVSGIAAHNKEKAELITQITANASNVFSKEYLETCSLEQLHGMAALAKNSAPATEPSVLRVPLFAGQGPITSMPQNNSKREPLGLPSIDFSKSA